MQGALARTPGAERPGVERPVGPSRALVPPLHVGQHACRQLRNGTARAGRAHEGAVRLELGRDREPGNGATPNAADVPATAHQLMTGMDIEWDRPAPAVQRSHVVTEAVAGCRAGLHDRALVSGAPVSHFALALAHVAAVDSGRNQPRPGVRRNSRTGCRNGARGIRRAPHRAEANGRCPLRRATSSAARLAGPTSET